MKTSELQALKELSAEVVRAHPGRVTIDGRGLMYHLNGLPISMFKVLEDIETARDKLVLLDQTIQALEGRKEPVKK